MSNIIVAGVPHPSGDFTSRVLFSRRALDLQFSGAASAVGSGDTGPWLFNVMADPTERTNLVTSTPDKAAELKAALDAAAQQTRYPFNCKGEPGATKVPINITCPGNVWTPWA